MAPKKEKGGKGKKGDDSDKTAGAQFTEVEKTFLELQIAECNRKVARLRTTVDEYEQRNEELQKSYDKLDEDRADIISFLKKQLNLKSEENVELKEKVKGLEETREIETHDFHERVAELEKNFMIMKDQLTSENKLLAGKLNTLEEFRAIRDDLMKKFEKQEQDFKDQELKYKRIIYEGEKKFVIGKDKLKKEMEARLLQLAQDFQDATELRIAASTHRVIRENIAINNELDNILSTQAKLVELNEKYKESEKAAKASKQLAEEERDKAISKSVVQLKVIDQLTMAYDNLKKEQAVFEKKTYDVDVLQAKMEELIKENENLSMQVRILEQNLHVRMTDQNKSSFQATKSIRECSKLKKILKDAAVAVQAALKLDKWAASDPTKEIMDRQLLLSRLLDIVTQYRDIQQTESLETVASFGKVYEEGDLGFIPKHTLTRKKSITVSTTPVISVLSENSISSDRTTDSAENESDTSLGSIKTIPSIQVIKLQGMSSAVPERESSESFITSMKSNETESENDQVEDGNRASVEKQLLESKMEIQKSILKDVFISQMTMQAQSSATQGTELDRKRKSVSIFELRTQAAELGREEEQMEILPVTEEHDENSALHEEKRVKEIKAEDFERIKEEYELSEEKDDK